MPLLQLEQALLRIPAPGQSCDLNGIKIVHSTTSHAGLFTKPKELVEDAQIEWEIQLQGSISSTPRSSLEGDSNFGFEDSGYPGEALRERVEIPVRSESTIPYVRTTVFLINIPESSA